MKAGKQLQSAVAVLCSGVLILFQQAAALEGMAALYNKENPGELKLLYLSTGQIITVAGGKVFWPAFSPNGKQIAYPDIGDHNIHVVNIDGTGNQTVIYCGTGYPSVNWADNGYIYYSPDNNTMCRVWPDGSGQETVHTSSYAIIDGTVSRDGSRGAWTSHVSSWEARCADFNSHEERSMGDGCSGTISADGNLVSHNLGSHTQAYIHYFSNGAVYKTIYTPEGTFNFHRFSHHDNNYLAFQIEANWHAYLMNIETGEQTYVADGWIGDYYPEEVYLNPTLSASLQGVEVLKGALNNGHAAVAEVFDLRGRVIKTLANPPAADACHGTAADGYTRIARFIIGGSTSGVGLLIR